MTVTVLARFEALPPHHDRLRTELEALIEPSLDEPGCLEFRLYTDPDQPEHMVMVEQWTDRAAIDRHLGTEHVEHFVAQAAGLLARPADIAAYPAPDDPA